MANIWIELKFLFGFWNVSDRRLWFSFFSNNEYYTILGISGNLTKRSSRFRNWSNNLFFFWEKYMYIYNRTFRGFLRDSIRNLIECHFAVVDNMIFPHKSADPFRCKWWWDIVNFFHRYLKVCDKSGFHFVILSQNLQDILPTKLRKLLLHNRKS